ncbi:MAG: GNAT family N-acetyltransferase [Pseudomonadaceae bacterium]|nr:MAG: GNAT family N-acetyltransferase [Pseudomonadaceae bacterium]
MSIQIVRADYHNPEDAAAIVALLDAYAHDPMGGAEPLPQAVKDALVPRLAELPHAFSVLAWAGDQAVGLVNCFMGFSTFVAQPLVNIHDVAVLPDYRGQGISQQMLAEVEAIARERGCCKLTLEVLEGNTPAQQAYLKLGFAGYALDPVMGRAMFWQKKLA